MTTAVRYCTFSVIGRQQRTIWLLRNCEVIRTLLLVVFVRYLVGDGECFLSEVEVLDNADI